MTTIVQDSAVVSGNYEICTTNRTVNGRDRYIPLKWHSRGQGFDSPYLHQLDSGETRCTTIEQRFAGPGRGPVSRILGTAALLLASACGHDGPLPTPPTEDACEAYAEALCEAGEMCWGTDLAEWCIEHETSACTNRSPPGAEAWDACWIALTELDTCPAFDAEAHPIPPPECEGLWSTVVDPRQPLFLAVGFYEIEWEDDGSRYEPAFATCTELELVKDRHDGAYDARMCGHHMQGTVREPCSCYLGVGPSAWGGEPVSDWCLCPNVASLYAELRWDSPDGLEVTPMRARPRSWP